MPQAAPSHPMANLTSRSHPAPQTQFQTGDNSAWCAPQRASGRACYPAPTAPSLSVCSCVCTGPAHARTHTHAVVHGRMPHLGQRHTPRLKQACVHPAWVSHSLALGQRLLHHRLPLVCGHHVSHLWTVGLCHNEAQCGCGGAWSTHTNKGSQACCAMLAHGATMDTNGVHTCMGAKTLSSLLNSFALVEI